MDIPAYWKDRRAAEATLPEFVYLVSLNKRRSDFVAGQIVEVTREIAARCITEETHRLATAEEVTTWQEENNRKAERQIARDREMAGLRVITMAPYKRGGR